MEHLMDLNYYHHRQQVSDYMSDNAACDCSRIVHRQLADAYAGLIATARAAATERASLAEVAA
jgi:hypothetical protein